MTRTESNSSVNTYKACPRKYRYHYSEFNRPTKTSTAMRLGNLVHEAFAYSLQGQASIKEAQAYIDTCFVYAEEQAKAREIVAYYAPLIGFDGVIQAYQIGTKRCIEKRFEVKIGGVSIMGYIDAIIDDGKGNIVLVDWKTRGQLLDNEQIALDNQLYMYAYVARMVLDIPITKVCQVQMKTVLPAKPKLLKAKTPKRYKLKKGEKIMGMWDWPHECSKMIYDELPEVDQQKFEPIAEKNTRLSKTMGLTTRSVFIDECIKLGVAGDVDASDYNHKFVDESEFLRMSYLDFDKVDVKMREFVEWIKKIESDTQMLPVNNANTCKWCQYRDLCLDNKRICGSIILGNSASKNVKDKLWHKETHTKVS